MVAKVGEVCAGVRMRTFAGVDASTSSPAHALFMRGHRTVEQGPSGAGLAQPTKENEGRVGR